MSEVCHDAGGDHYLDLLKKCLTAYLYDESAWQMVTPGKPSFRKPARYVRDLLARLFYYALRRESIYMVRARPFDGAAREIGQGYPLFGYSMIGLRRLDNVQECVEQVLKEGVPGDLAETGIWRGGTSMFMRAILKRHGITDRIVWAADSFEGLPKPAAAVSGLSEWDLSDDAFLKVSLEQVKENFRRFGLLDEQVRFLKGWFADTLPEAPIKRLAVLRLDGDLYASTMDALTALYPKLSPGGYIIVDDYYQWPGCRAAVDEYRASHGIGFPLHQIDWAGCYWRRSEQEERGAGSEGTLGRSSGI